MFPNPKYDLIKRTQRFLKDRFTEPVSTKDRFDEKKGYIVYSRGPQLLALGERLTNPLRHAAFCSVLKRTQT